MFRFMVGFNIGCVPQSVTLYAEFLPSQQRGKCVVLLDCFWALGAVLEVKGDKHINTAHMSKGLSGLMVNPTM